MYEGGGDIILSDMSDIGTLSSLEAWAIFCYQCNAVFCKFLGIATNLMYRLDVVCT